MNIITCSIVDHIAKRRPSARRHRVCFDCECATSPSDEIGA
jgi:hypothetical protein